jgi:hypothetical protein
LIDLANAVGQNDALGLLNSDQRRVLELMYFQGFTQTEIAQHLSKPLGTGKEFSAECAESDSLTGQSLRRFNAGSSEVNIARVRPVMLTR